MNIILKNSVIEDIKNTAKFTVDGCACGDFAYQIDTNLWITFYRSCRKSSGTPDNKLWHIHEVEFYDDVKFSYYVRDGVRYIDQVEGYGNKLDNYRLNTEQEMVIMKHLKKITKEHWRNEYRNED